MELLALIKGNKTKQRKSLQTVALVKWRQRIDHAIDFTSGLKELTHISVYDRSLLIEYL